MSGVAASDTAARGIFAFFAQLGERWRGLAESAANYHLTDRWHVDGSLNDVASALFDSESMSGWWSQFRDVRTIHSGDAQGLGRLIHSRVKGFLPYQLHLEFHVVKVEYPTYFEVEVGGDFRGKGAGHLRETADGVEIDLSLDIALERRTLRLLSLFARALLIGHHRWTMNQGLCGLNRELQRRRLSAATA